MQDSPSYDVNLYCPSMRINPFATYSKMQPVCQVNPRGIWVISGYDLATYVLKNTTDFSSTNNNMMAQPEWMDEEYIPDYRLIFEDPAKHQKIRHIFTKTFQIGENSIRNKAASLITNNKNKGPIDFLSDFIRPYIDYVDSYLIGFDDPASCVTLNNWLKLLEMPPPPLPDLNYIRDLKEASFEKERFFETISHPSCPSPRNSIRHLLQTMVGDEKFTQMEFSTLLELLAVAVYQAPRHFLSHVVILLAHNPSILNQLTQSPAQIPQFVEEALRFNSSMHFVFRRTLNPVMLSGVLIPQGAGVIINLASANRDPTYFPNPDTFDLTRHNSRKHIAFGYGIHNCLGAAVTRIVTKILVETIVNRVRKINCPAISELPWFYSLVAHGVERLPVALKY